MRIKQLLESATAGGTSTASVATVTKGSKTMLKRQKPTDNALDSGKLFQETNAVEGSVSKEKQKTPYKDINSAEYRAAADKQKQRMDKDKAAEPGKKLADKIGKKGVAEGSGANKTYLAMAYLKAVVMAPMGTPEKRRILNWQEKLEDEFDIEMDTATLAQMLPQFDSMLQAGKLDKLQNRMASRGELEIGESEQGVAEVAPPGAKAERMVKHIKKGYAKDGKLTKTEKSKAYGAAWKAHNAGKVEEQSVEENKKGVRAVKHAVKPRNFVAKNAVQSGAGAHKDKKKAQKQGDVKHKAKEPAYESKLWAALDRRIIK
jgi:hypothetical protein